MKKMTVFLFSIFLLAACENTLNNVPVDDSVNSGPTPDEVDFDGDVHFCEHKYSDERDFYYQGKVKSEFEVQGQMVYNFTFTLLNGEKRYLSGNEFKNYVCQ